MLVVASMAIGSCGPGNDEPPLERARSLVEAGAGFGTAIESGDTFAHVAELLLDEGRACDDPCPAVLQASAYVQLVAVAVLGCTQPGIHDARRAVLHHLEEVSAAPESTELQPPALPRC